MKCEICGKEIEKSSYSSAILCSSECFGKHFWNEIVKDKNNRIIINGHCYVDGGNKPDAIHTSWLGFNGNKFNIEFFDGRKLTTNNLWCNGEIPKEYRKLLPNNAKLIW
ncbi:MAG: hypothetical protein ACLS59_07335 [Clostridia bacterium]